MNMRYPYVYGGTHHTKQPSLSRDGGSAFLLGPYDLARDVALPIFMSVCLFYAQQVSPHGGAFFPHRLPTNNGEITCSRIL